MQLPSGPFGCILADPPWAFQTYASRKHGDGVTPHRAAEDHYPTMDFESMAALPVADIAAKDCMLFMWVVDSHLDEALNLGRAWGFKYKTRGFVWMKQKLINADQIDLFTGDIAEPAIGMGYTTRKQMEDCWLFSRGKPKILSHSVRQVIIEPRREHSRKPDCQYERIEALVGGPRLEMFSRTSREGWTSWGLDAGKFGEAA